MMNSYCILITRSRKKIIIMEMVEMGNYNKTLVIEDIMNHCEISKKAIVVFANLKFFLRTQEDRQRFINEYKTRGLHWKIKKPFLCILLAREIGSYHYEYVNFSDLLKMDERSALECLFQQPINDGMFREYKKRSVGLAKMYSLKINNPNCGHFTTTLAFT